MREIEQEIQRRESITRRLLESRKGIDPLSWSRAGTPAGTEVRTFEHPEYSNYICRGRGEKARSIAP